MLLLFTIVGTKVWDFNTKLIFRQFQYLWCYLLPWHMAVFEYYMEGRGAERIYWFLLPFYAKQCRNQIKSHFIDYVFDISLMGPVLVWLIIISWLKVYIDACFLSLTNIFNGEFLNPRIVKWVMKCWFIFGIYGLQLHFLV